MVTISTLGPYQIANKIGEGGMGAVYAARHVSIEREVAIKFLAREYAASSDLVLRFFNEARAAARIDHPGIVQIFDSGLLPDGAPYIVMELLKGESLSCRLRSSGSSTRQSIQVGWQVASAISAAHAVGIVHRDLKPDNIMLIPDPFIDGGERVKILDFGIAKLSCSRKTNTASNVIMGTPRYMSPEQCRGAAHVDDRSDVYSLGVILFEMLSGRALFTAENPNEYLFFHVLEAPPRLASVVEGIPAELANLVDHLLGKAADQRPAMREVAEQLHRLLRTMPVAAVASELLTQPSHPIPSVLAGAICGRSTGRWLPALKTSYGLDYRLFAAAGLLCALGGLGLYSLFTHRLLLHSVLSDPIAIFRPPIAFSADRAQPLVGPVDMATSSKSSSGPMRNVLASDDTVSSSAAKLDTDGAPLVVATPRPSATPLLSPPHQFGSSTSRSASTTRSPRPRKTISRLPTKESEKLEQGPARPTLEELLGE